MKRIFDIKIEKEISFGNVKIYTDSANQYTFTIDDKYYLADYENYATVFCNLKRLKFNSILVGGLGFGIVPYFLENRSNIKEIDIIENSLDVINAINEFGHLKNTNIIYDDFISYKTDKKYDLILADLWWMPYELTDEIKSKILDNYENNLTDYGGVFFPIIDELYQIEK